MEHVTNGEVLHRINKKKEISRIKKRKLEYLGHIIREKRYELLWLIIEGKIKKEVLVKGRYHTLWNLREWFKMSFNQLNIFGIRHFEKKKMTFCRTVLLKVIFRSVIH